MIRHTRSHPCPICDGSDQDKRGQSKRCFGFTSDDAAWVHCTREELAGPLDRNEKSSAYSHKMNGLCRCGQTHGTALSDISSQVLCYYEYRDEEDKPLFRVARKLGKQFFQERYEKGSWIGGKGALDGVRRVLYRLPELIASQGTVLVVEGEKDVDTARALGFPATCNSGGAGKWQVSYSAFLKDRDIIIIPDADEKGRGHADQINDLLQGYAKSIKIIELPDAKDLTAWVEAGGSAKLLLEIIEKPIDWRKKLRTKLINATELLEFVDKPIPYIIKPIIVRGSLTQLQGTQKGGKSAFANYLALLASFGKYPEHLSSEGPFKVTYFSWEDPKLMMAQKLALYGRGLEIESFLPKNLNYIFRPALSIEDDSFLEAMKAMVKETDTDILILDTLAHTHDCDENAAHEMRGAMLNLAALAEDMNIGVVYLHHIAKQAGDRTPQDKSRGSSAIAAAWHVLIDWGVREDGSNVNPVQIQSKFLHKFLRWNVEYDHNGSEEKEPTQVRWNIEEAEPPTTLSKKRQNKLDQVWVVAQSLLPQHPNGISKQNLRIALDCSENTAGSYLEALSTDGRMMRSSAKFGGGRGNKILYKLPPKDGSSGNLQNITLNNDNSK